MCVNEWMFFNQPVFLFVRRTKIFICEMNEMSNLLETAKGSHTSMNAARIIAFTAVLLSIKICI